MSRFLSQSATVPHSLPRKPLLDPSEADRFRPALDAIIESLRLTPNSQINGSLVTGHAGLSLCFAELARFTGNESLLESAADHLDSALAWVAATPIGTSFYGGLTGVAWAMSLVSRQLGDETDSDDLQQVDQQLIRYLQTVARPVDFDLISGVTGIGVYALERIQHESGRALAEQAVSLLLQLSERLPNNRMTWRTDPRLLWGETLRHYPDGVYNLGVAHGVPGVIGFLAQAYSAAVLPDVTGMMLDGAVTWLLEREQADYRPSRFPGFYLPEGLTAGARLAWCYGDPSLALAIYHAGIATAQPAWLSAARRISGMVAPMVDPEAAGVKDPTLCHGAAGLVQINSRLFDAFGDVVYRSAAVSWLDHLLRFRRPEIEVYGGFAAWKPPRLDEVIPWEWIPEAGILEGAAGIALALGSAGSSKEPFWDRMLLLSPPGPAGEASHE